MQEALTNIRKYAGPHVDVHIKESWTMVCSALSVTDNGRGAAANIDGHTPGYGLLGMKERIESAGAHCRLALNSAEASVMATLPYGGKEPATDETGEQYASEQSESCKHNCHIQQSEIIRRSNRTSHSRQHIGANPRSTIEQTQETNLHQPVAIIVRTPLQHLRITAPNLHDLLTSLKLKSVELANTSNSRGLNWVERFRVDAAPLCAHGFRWRRDIGHAAGIAHVDYVLFDSSRDAQLSL